MSFDGVIFSLEKLVSIHQRFIEVSERKTDFIKNGQIEKLQDEILQERKLVLLLEQAEEKRKKAVESWFATNNVDHQEMTITTMLTMLTDKEKQSKLASVTTDLTEAITTLKRSEQLNEELLEQSMQFVQMSLNLLSPSLEQMNYGNKEQESNRDHSVFDSRA